jgi:hypothetical protein
LEYSLTALSYSFALKNLFPDVLHASASTGGFAGIAGAGAGAGAGVLDPAVAREGLVGTLCGGGRGPTSSVGRDVSRVFAPFCLGRSFGGVGFTGLAGGSGGDAARSRSMSMGVGWSVMADMADKRFSSSGGRLRGWESLSYRWLEDRV